jgi:hypothetical protein
MFGNEEVMSSIPREMSEILEIVAPGRRLPWWEIHRWHVDVYGGSTRAAEFQTQLGVLQSRGLLRHCSDNMFELTEKGKSAMSH